MDAPLSLIRVQQQGPCLLVRVEGRATMRLCPGLRRLAECCPARNVRQLFIDLSACSYMDSTFLGTLLCLHRVVSHWRNGELMLVTPSPQCRQQLRQVGLLEVFTITESGPPADSEWTVLDEACDDLGYFKSNVVQAHQALAALPGSGEQFRSAAECMTSDLEQQRD